MKSILNKTARHLMGRKNCYDFEHANLCVNMQVYACLKDRKCLQSPPKITCNININKF